MPDTTRSLSNEATAQTACAIPAAPPTPSPPPSSAHMPVPGSSHVMVARAVAVLDSSAMPGGQGLATLVLPPDTQGVGNTNPVYGLQLSAAVAVTQANRCAVIRARYASWGAPHAMHCGTQ